MELEVIFIEPKITALHETVMSILNQLNIHNINLYVIITNHTNLDISSEIALLEQANISTEKPKSVKPRFSIRMTSGNIISRTYLYKAISYLKHNKIIAVAPEYTFCRIEKLSLMAYIQNDNLLPEILENVVIDRSKLCDGDNYLPRVKIIRDTVGAIQSTFDSPYELIKQIRQKSMTTFLRNTLISPKNIALAAQARQSFRKDKISRKQKIFKKAKILCGRSIFFRNIISIFENHNAIPIDYEKYISAPFISNTMRLELLDLSDISYSLKGVTEMNFINLTTCLVAQPEVHLSVVNNIISQLGHSNYSYFMVLPWIISGGIDLFAINYLKTLAELGENVLVIITNDHHLSFTKEQIGLPDSVDIVDFPRLANKGIVSQDDIPEIINSLVSIYKPRRFHNIASEMGYKCLERYGANIRKSCNIIYSSYNYILSEKGEYIGYTVQELPRVFMPEDIITTDNEKSKKIWTNHYNINPDNILVHNQLFDIKETSNSYNNRNTKRILWAAHVRPEKNPKVVLRIAKELEKYNIEIDCYGLFDPDQWEDGNNPLNNNIPNVHYCGKYSNFFEDIDLGKYEAFLYTSLADGMPNVLIEAGLAGLPIISSAIGGIPDMIKNNGFLIKDPNSVQDYVEAIKEIINDPSKAKKTAMILKKRLINEHSKEQFIRQVKEMLDRSK